MIGLIQRFRQGPHFNIIGRARTWFLISGVCMVIGLGSLFFGRGINTGLEFRGGTDFQLASEKPGVSVADIRRAVEDAGVGQPTVQAVGTNGFRVQTEHLDPDVQQKVLAALGEATGVDENNINITDVGPKWGAQITSKAIRALVIFLVVAVIYLSIRLEPKMAGSAMLALVHDMVITAGVYSLSGFEVTPSTVIALLTILGYSLYDTVVIFDRVKDRTATLSAAGRVTYSEAANEALNQVLLRSINTSISSLFPVGSLLFVGSYLLGAHTLRELALALFVGLATGAYSSVFIATPALALWKEREPRWATLRARLQARTGEGTGAVTSAEQLPSVPAEQNVAEPGSPAATTRTRTKSQQKRKRRKHGR